MSDEEESNPLEFFGKEVQEESTKKKLMGALRKARITDTIERADDDDEDDNDGESKEKEVSLWEVLDGGNVFLPSSERKVTREIPSGVYTPTTAGNSLILRRENLNCDDLVRFSDSVVDNILKEIDVFWTRGDLFKKYGYMHRRGILMFGPAGSGKSAAVYLIIKDIIERDGIVLLGKYIGCLTAIIKIIKRIEPQKKIVAVFEDIDSIVESQGEDELLSFLDGEDQMDNVLSIASTNYPEKLDPRIVARPRRFDRLIHVGPPNEIVRREYFTKKLKIEEGIDDVDSWVNESNGFSFAAMADLVISVKCLGIPFEKAVKTLRNILFHKKTSADYFGATKLGFSTDKEVESSI